MNYLLKSIMRIFNFLNSNNKNHKSVRIKTDIGDKFVSINLNQTYESLDILSLKIFQKDLYRLFDADYGVIVGRVLGQGVGIPNARVSVFIPINEEVNTPQTTLEDLKKLEAISIYPYESVLDRNGNGKIYNLLPKYGRNRNFNGFADNEYGIGATPKTPVGSFLEKEEILINETVAYVYEKYYKYTTVTNESGDYILTVPSNRGYTVTMSCDITDIGRFSTCPALLKLEGYPENYFTEDGTQLNTEIQLENLPNIDIQNQGITVKPLWSQNLDNPNVGINRLDFTINKKIKPFVTVFGNQFTQNGSAWWGDKIQFRFLMGIRALCFKVCIPNIACVDIKIPGIVPFFDAIAFVRKMCTLRGGKGDYEPWGFKFVLAWDECSKSEALGTINDGLNADLQLTSHIKGLLDIKLFSIKASVPEDDAKILNGEINPNISNNDGIYSQYSYNSDIELYKQEKYVTYQNNGSFITLINCNRNKVITNEEGILIPVDESSEKGVYTAFRGYFYVTNLSDVDNPPTRYRVGKVRLKVPQFFDYTGNENKWIWKHFKFEFGKLYSVAQKNMVRLPNMSPTTEAEDDFGEGYTESVGWASQTNLLFVGDKEQDFGFNSIVPNDNPELNYINSYNHIVNLGEDKLDAIGDEGQGGQTATEDVLVPPPPPQFNWKWSLIGLTEGLTAPNNFSTQNVAVGVIPTFDNLKQDPIVVEIKRYSATTLPSDEYIYSGQTNNYGNNKNQLFYEIRIDITTNTGGIVPNSANYWQVSSISAHRWPNTVADITNFSSYKTNQEIENYLSTKQGTFLQVVGFSNFNTNTPYVYAGLTDKYGIRPITSTFTQTNIFKDIIEDLQINTPTSNSVGDTIIGGFIDDGYYLFKIGLTSNIAIQLGSQPQEGRIKYQYFLVNIKPGN